MRLLLKTKIEMIIFTYNFYLVLYCFTIANNGKLKKKNTLLLKIA